MSFNPKKIAEQKNDSPPPAPSKGEELDEQTKYDIETDSNIYNDEDFDEVIEVDF